MAEKEPFSNFLSPFLLLDNLPLFQLNQLYKLLDSRFPAKSVIYVPNRRLNYDPATGSPSNRSRNSPRSLNRPLTAPHGARSSPTQLSPSLLQQSPGAVVGGELVNSCYLGVISRMPLRVANHRVIVFQIDGDSPQFLKYNFPPISSSLRRTSLRKNQKRQSTETTLSPEGGTKLVPILKSPRPNGTDAAAPNDTSVRQTKRKRSDRSSSSGGGSGGGNKRSKKGASSSAKQGAATKPRRRFGFVKKVRKLNTTFLDRTGGNVPTFFLIFSSRRDHPQCHLLYPEGHRSAS